MYKKKLITMRILFDNIRYLETWNMFRIIRADDKKELAEWCETLDANGESLYPAPESKAVTEEEIGIMGKTLEEMTKAGDVDRYCVSAEGSNICVEFTVIADRSEMGYTAAKFKNEQTWRKMREILNDLNWVVCENRLYTEVTNDEQLDAMRFPDDEWPF